MNRKPIQQQPLYDAINATDDPVGADIEASLKRILVCGSCGHATPVNDWQALGADEDSLLCPKCLTSRESPTPETGPAPT